MVESDPSDHLSESNLKTDHTIRECHRKLCSHVQNEGLTICWNVFVIKQYDLKEFRRMSVEKNVSIKISEVKKEVPEHKISVVVILGKQLNLVNHNFLWLSC